MKQVLPLFTVFFFFVLVIVTCLFWYHMQWRLDLPITVKNAPEINYTIQAGMSLKDIAHDLTAQGILDQPYYFIFAGRLQNKETHIKAGEYILHANLTQRQLLEKFIDGKVVQHSLTLIEGWSYKQVMAAINNNKILVKMLPPDPDSATIMSSIGYPEVHAEGRFFPDTYHFPNGTTDIEFLQRAYKRTLYILEKEWRTRYPDLPYKTAEEALIMASIIEKETASAEERATIAGVFVRRLRKGMRLQTDPTVIYAMGETYKGNIRRRDLRIESPYNTYLHKGLPPTPIALAGAEAIHAALHPEPGDTLYFVAKGNGRHHFSKTLQEHQWAVNKYQRTK